MLTKNSIFLDKIRGCVILRFLCKRKREKKRKNYTDLHMESGQETTGNMEGREEKERGERESKKERTRVTFIWSPARRPQVTWKAVKQEFLWHCSKINS